MSGRPEGDRWYARWFGLGSLVIWVVLAATVVSMTSRADEVPRWVTISAIALLVVLPGVVLVPTGLHLLLTPYVELQADRLIVRAMGARRTYPFAEIERVEHGTGTLLLYGRGQQRPWAQVLTIILGASGAAFEAALRKALRGPSAPSP